MTIRSCALVAVPRGGLLQELIIVLPRHHQHWEWPELNLINKNKYFVYSDWGFRGSSLITNNSKFSSHHDSLHQHRTRKKFNLLQREKNNDSYKDDFKWYLSPKMNILNQYQSTHCRSLLIVTEARQIVSFVSLKSAGHALPQPTPPHPTGRMIGSENTLGILLFLPRLAAAHTRRV